MFLAIVVLLMLTVGGYVSYHWMIGAVKKKLKGIKVDTEEVAVSIMVSALITFAWAVIIQYRIF